MATVEPAKCNCFQDSFCTAVDDISEGLSTSITAAAIGNWENWDGLCRDISLNPLIVS